MTPSTVEETTAHPRAGTDLPAGLPGDYAGLREHFTRQVRTSPLAYRRTFRSSATAGART